MPKLRFADKTVSDPLLTLVSSVARHMAHCAKVEVCDDNHKNPIIIMLLTFGISAIIINNMD